jgi:hypothetical protein
VSLHLDLRVVEVRVLGPVEVIGWLLPPERAAVTELACKLDLHRDGPGRYPGSIQSRTSNTRRSQSSQLTVFRSNLSGVDLPSGAEIEAHGPRDREGRAVGEGFDVDRRNGQRRPPHPRR